MIRKYHNHKPQTTPWHREEEPLNHYEKPGRHIKQPAAIGYGYLKFYPGLEKSNLTYVMVPRLSRESYTLVVMELVKLLKY